MLSNLSLTSNTIFFTLHLAAIILSYLAFLFATVFAILYLIQDRNLKNRSSAALFNHLPNLSLLDRFNYRFIGFGFPLLTLGIICGSLWAKQVWGGYWSWNLRESYSLILWLLYAVTLHVRLTSKVRGKKIAWLSILAFVIIVITLVASACEVAR